MALTNSQYDSIIREYEKTQIKNRHLLEKRFEEVHKSIPQYKEIEDTISSLCVSQGKKMLSGDDHALSELKEILKEKAESKSELLLKNGFPKNYLEPLYECQDCQDTGYINGEKCHCLKQAIISLLYEQSNIKEMIANENFENLSYSFYKVDDLNRFKNAVDASKKFIQDFNLDYHNLFFYGTVGTGKSFLSGCIAKELIEKGHSVIYFSASGLFEILSKNVFDYKNKEELNHLYDDLYNCELLIIDDLGTELTNNFVASSLFSCLNERHLRKHATIISTNLSLEELSIRYSERIFSRITSNFDLFKLSGQDIRMYKKRTANRK